MSTAKGWKELGTGLSLLTKEEIQNQTVFKVISFELVVHVLQALRAHLYEQRQTIDSLIKIVQSRTGNFNPASLSQRGRQSTPQSDLPKLKAAVSQLNTTSEQLSQKLFDLNQKSIEIQLTKRTTQQSQIKQLYRKECQKLREKYTKQNEQLLQQIQYYKQTLQNYEMNQKQKMKSELNHYLLIIEQIKEELDIMRSDNLKNSARFTQSSACSNYCCQVEGRVCNCQKYIGNYPETVHLKTQPYHAYSQYYYPECSRKQKMQRFAANQRYTEASSKDKRSTFLVVKDPINAPHLINPLPSSRMYQVDKKVNFLAQQKGSVKSARPRSSQDKLKIKGLMPSKQKKREEYQNMGEGRRVEQKNMRMQKMQNQLDQLKRKLQRQVRDMILK